MHACAGSGVSPLVCVASMIYRTCRGHVGLVKENPAEVVLVRENLGLLRKESPTTIDHVDTRQPVLPSYFLHAVRTNTVGVTRGRGRSSNIDLDMKV